MLSGHHLQCFLMSDYQVILHIHLGSFQGKAYIQHCAKCTCESDRLLEVYRWKRIGFLIRIPDSHVVINHLKVQYGCHYYIFILTIKQKPHSLIFSTSQLNQTTTKIKPYTITRKTYPVIIEETSNLKRGSQKASTRTPNWSEGSKPNMLEIVLFIASIVFGGTSFWIRDTSKGSISCIKFERIAFWKKIISQI